MLDEAHNIRNSLTKAFKAVLQLKSKNKWCLTGTPLQNKAEDIQSLFQFLRLAPFEDKSVFMRYIGRPVQNGDAVGTSFLRTSLKSACLRRTKDLLGLQIPPKEEFLCEVSLNDDAREGGHAHIFCIYFPVHLSNSQCTIRFLRALLTFSNNSWNPKPRR